MDIIKIIKKSGVKIVSLSDFRKLLNIEKDNTSYKIAERLVAERFLLRLKKGVYLSTFNPPDSLEIANAVYTPSYISLESALNYHGILLQFPYSVTSVSPKKSKKMLIDEKALDYSPINKRDFHKMCQRIDHLPFLNKLKEIGI